METILLLNNLDGSGGDQIYLPTSLELTMYLSDPAPPAPAVPAPLAALGAAAGWSWSRRLRRRCRASSSSGTILSREMRLRAGKNKQLLSVLQQQKDGLKIIFF